MSLVRLDGRNVLELVVGIIAVALFAVLLVVAVLFTGHKSNSGYEISASFSKIDGLSIGSDVRLAGITIGHVVGQTVNPKTFQATVVFTIRNDIKLPLDTAAIITSNSLLGGKYIALLPGASGDMLQSGGMISQTQSSISMEQLLNKFIFSVTDTLNNLQNRSKSSTPTNEGGSHP